MKKIDRALTVVYAVAGSLTFLAFFVYFLKLLFYPEGRMPLFVSVFVLLAVALPVIFVRLLRRLGRAFFVLKCAACAALVFFVVSFAVMTAFIFTAAPDAAPDSFSDDTVFLVFGARVRDDGTPSAVLAERLDRAADAMASAPGSVCVVSGGKGSDEPFSEAEVMRDYLVSRGVDPERVIVEDRAASTAENVEFSLPLVSGTGRGDLVCVSTFNHTPRIMLLCRSRGIEARFINSVYPEKYLVFPALVREYLAYANMFFAGNAITERT